ncbi:MAG: universal stress protein [Calditrichaceae bacterium]
MIKRILVPLDPSPYTDKVIELACKLAKNNKAELTGLVILDIPGIEKSIGPVPAGALYYAEKLEKKKETQASERIKALLEKFVESCKASGVTCHTAHSQGSPSERIIAESIYYDAIMVGLRTFYHFQADDRPGDSLTEIMNHSITPVYGVPETFSVPDIPAEKLKVLLAFDGSLPAARAMQRLAQLANADLMEVMILTSNANKETADYYLDNAEAYLRAHNFKNIQKTRITGNIIDAVEKKYLDWAHVVVVGAHSKQGIFDFMLGSLTKFLIKADKKPVIIGQ